ncbi:MAG: SpoIIE family protein phosphatase [Bacteroidales bacterium]|nr:SpoIIE family protein phosphatase [Bacteroidales bacterium]
MTENNDLSKIRIMVVDDEVDLEPLIRQKFRHKIRNGEYHFVFAHNGLEALAKLIEFPDIGIILSDINMPEMDGLTLLMKLKELKNPSLRTVIVSAYGDMDNIRIAMNRGAFDFLIKPINFTDLELTINKTLEEIKLQRKALLEHEQLISIQQDLTVAREIQQAILPKIFPPFPHLKSFDISGFMEPAKEVGGDFFDFFIIDNDRLGFVIGDVSGKGVPAAIFMAISRTLIRATGLKGIKPGECLQYVNKLLCNESVACMFVTVFYGIMDIKTGQIEYCNAGHNPPFIIRNNGSISPLKLTENTILGCFETHQFKTSSLDLNPGDVLMLYTDGITEAFDIKGDIYGEARLESLLPQLHKQDITQQVKNIYEDVLKFAGKAPQSDDITLLSIKYFGNAQTC